MKKSYQLTQVGGRLVNSFTLRCERCGVRHTLHGLKKKTAKLAFLLFGWRMVEAEDGRRLWCAGCVKSGAGVEVRAEEYERGRRHSSS